MDRAESPRLSVDLAAMARLMPMYAWVTADGRFAYVTSEAADAVYLIDLAQHKVVKTIKTGKRPRRLVLLAAANELWVSNELEASVAVIDTMFRSAMMASAEPLVSPTTRLPASLDTISRLPSGEKLDPKEKLSP